MFNNAEQGSLCKQITVIGSRQKYCLYHNLEVSQVFR